MYLNAVDRLFPECRAALEAIAADVPERLDRAGDVALREWATTWGFSSSRFVRIARLTAGRMRRGKVRGGWMVTGGAWPPDVPALDNPTWDPTIETQAAFLARVGRSIDMVKRLPGLRPAPRRRALGLHIEWLVLYQVGGKTLNEISETVEGEEGLELSTVSRVVTDNAKNPRLVAPADSRPLINLAVGELGLRQ